MVVATPIGSFALLFTLAILWRRYRARSGHFRAGVWDPNTPTKLESDWPIQGHDDGTYATAKPMFELPPHPGLGRPDDLFCHECRARLRYAPAEPIERDRSDSTSSTLVQPTFSEKTFRMTRIASDPQMDRKTSIITVASDLTGDGGVGQREAAVSIASGAEGAYASSDALGAQYGRSGSTSTLSTLVGGGRSSTGLAQLGYPLRKISIAQARLQATTGDGTNDGNEAGDEMDELDEDEEEKLRYTIDMVERRPSVLSITGSMTVRKISAGGAEDAVSIRSGLVPDVGRPIVIGQGQYQDPGQAGTSRSSTLETLDKGETADGRPTSLLVTGLRDSWAVSPGQVELAERVSLAHAKPGLHRASYAPALATQQKAVPQVEHVPGSEGAGVFATNNPFRLDVPHEDGLSRGDKRRSVELDGVPPTAALEVDVPVSPKTPVPSINPNPGVVDQAQLPSIVISSESHAQTSQPPPIPRASSTKVQNPGPEPNVDSKIDLTASSALARLAVGSTTAAASALLADHTREPTNKPRRPHLLTKSPKIRPDSLVLTKSKRRSPSSHDHHLPHWLKIHRKPDPWPILSPSAEAGVPQVHTAPLEIKKRRHTLSAAVGLPRITRSPPPEPPNEYLASPLREGDKRSEDGKRGGRETRPKSAGAGSTADFGVFEKWQSFAPSRPVLKDKRRPSALSLKESNQSTDTLSKKAEKRITHLADVVAAAEPALEPDKLLSVGGEGKSRRESWVLDTPAALRESMSAEPLRNSLLFASAGPATARMTSTVA